MFDMNHLLNGLPEDVTLTFFAAFSRFEYALMELDFFRGTRRSKIAQETLAQQLGPSFFAEAEARVPTLVHEPPKQLVVRDGRFEFGEAPSPARDTKDLLGFAWRVRNNLFHGNKHLPANRERDERLMQEVLVLIGLILDKIPTLHSVFSEPQS